MPARRDGSRPARPDDHAAPPQPAPLTPRERSALKGRAHALEPVVHIGHAGITDAVVSETDRALAAHELIKVKLGAAGRDERTLLIEELCARTGAADVQRVGKIVVLWRPRDDDDS